MAFLLSIHESSLDLFSVCFGYLVQLVLILCCTGNILDRLSTTTLAILIGSELGYLLDFTFFLLNAHLRVQTISFFSALSWNYGKLLRVFLYP